MRPTLPFIITLFVSTFVGITATAKNAFPGYAELRNGERIEGQVFVINPIANELGLKMRDLNGKRHKFNAHELSRYAFTIEQFDPQTRQYINREIEYVRKEVEDAPLQGGATEIMIERELGGIVQLYNQYIDETYRIGGRIEHCYYVERQDGSLPFSKLTRDNYEELLTFAFADFPALKEKVGTSGYGYKYIATMIKTYNERAVIRDALVSSDQ